MSSPLSMTTTKRPKKRRGRMMWRVRRDELGELKFFPIKDEADEAKQGGTIFVTMTLKMIRDEKILAAVEAIRAAGGTVTKVNGRRMSVEVGGENVEEVGDVLDSFGCQWDLN